MAQVVFKTTNTLNLQKANRDLSPEELEAEEKAVKFPSSKYKRIKPVFGTLGYLFRNMNGNNDSIIEFLRVAQNTNNSKFIKLVLILWENMDEYSQKRVDIFDWLCRKYDIPIRKFFAVVQEGMFDYEEALAKTSLAGYSEEFIHLVKTMAAREKNVQDRKMMQEMLGRTAKQEPLVKIEDNSKHEEVHIHNNSSNAVPSFVHDIRSADEGIRTNSPKDELPSKEIKELPPATTEFIEAEIITEEKEVDLVEVNDANLEFALRNAIKEL